MCQEISIIWTKLDWGNYALWHWGGGGIGWLDEIIAVFLCLKEWKIH